MTFAASLSLFVFHFKKAVKAVNLEFDQMYLSKKYFHISRTTYVLTFKFHAALK